MITLSPNAVSDGAPSKWKTGWINIQSRDVFKDEAELQEYADAISPWLINVRLGETRIERPPQSDVIIETLAIRSSGLGDPNNIARSNSVLLEPAAMVSNFVVDHINATERLQRPRKFGRTLAGRSGWQATQDALSRWERLGLDWDGEDGIPPLHSSLDAAKRFVTLLEVVGAAVPSRFIAGDGEFGFRWTKHGDFASVAFPLDGHLVGFLRVGSRAPLKIDLPAEEGILETDFIHALRSFA